MAEHRLNRVGDSQAMPIPNDSAIIHDLVAEDLQRRKTLGITRYGTGLQAFNGRNALLDAYEEILDMAVYLKQRLVEEAAGPVRDSDGENHGQEVQGAGGAPHQGERQRAQPA